MIFRARRRRAAANGVGASQRLLSGSLDQAGAGADPALCRHRRAAGRRGPAALSGLALIAAALLRPERSPHRLRAARGAFARLKGNLGRDRRAKAINIDGYQGLNAFIPPPSGAGSFSSIRLSRTRMSSPARAGSAGGSAQMGGRGFHAVASGQGPRRGGRLRRRARRGLRRERDRQRPAAGGGVRDRSATACGPSRPLRDAASSSPDPPFSLEQGAPIHSAEPSARRLSGAQARHLIERLGGAS